MIRILASRLRKYLATPLLERISELQKTNRPESSAPGQKALIASYRQSFRQHPEFPISFHEAGFRIHSQHDEDGILLFIFALIGATNMKSVELCAGDGVECNTANLIINHRWTGLLCDGAKRNIERARQYFATHPDTRYWPPTIVEAWITKKNINNIIHNNGFTGEIDLLSLDMDGVDYWIWKEIDCITPRVIVLEFNHLWGPDKAVTVPYSDDFVADFSAWGSDYAGASLQAFIKLGREKGYRLVGTNVISTNAFFIRDDISCTWLPEVAAATCFSHPRAQFGIKTRFPTISEKPWVKV